ncbi:MAG: hypothetical protein ING32_12535 [Curvibacter sp.]|nr:hypothetical protein [Curvibacter sp.]
MTDTPRQRWLVISHAFNMDGRASSHTITDKLPHLKAAGIEVVVLSGVSGEQDAELEHYRLWPAGPAGLRFDLRHVLRKRFGKGLTYRMLMLLASLLLVPGMVVEKLLRPLESSWSWWLPAYVKGRKLAHRQRFDLIYSTGGAYAAHLAGRALKFATGTPWLAEVHDPLVVPGTTPRTPHQKKQADIERQICTDADIAIWFTDQALASARARHPQLGDRGKMMLPGIDKPFDTLPPYQPGAKFVVGHFGSLSASRSLVPFIKALELLHLRRPDLIAQTELHIYGGMVDAPAQELLQTSPVGEQVRPFGRIEADPATGLSGRDQVLHRMRAVDVLLLLHGEDPLCEEYIPSKLYEYLWMQRPILSIVHRNPQMSAMIRGEGHVTVETGRSSGDSAPEVVAQPLANELESLYERWRSAGLPDSAQGSPYTTQAAVTRLVGWVGELDSPRP